MPHRTAIHFLKKEHESTVLPLPPTVAQPQNGAPPRLGFATTTTTTTTAMVNNSSSDFTATNGSSGDVIGTDSKRSNEFLQFSILGNTFSDTGSDADENNNSHREQQRGTTKRHTTKRHHHQPFRDDDDEDDYDEPTSLCELSVADGIPLTSSKSFSSPNTKLGVSFHSTSSPIKRVGTGRLQQPGGGGNSNNNVSASFNMEDSASNVTLVHRLQSSRGAFASINLPNLSINNVARGSSAHAHTTNSHQHHAKHTMSKRGDSSENILGSLDLDNPLPMSASQRGGVGSNTSGGGLQKVSSGSELFSEDVSEVDDEDGVTVAEQTPAAQALILNSPGQAGGFASHAPSASASKSAEPSFELPSFLTNASLGLSFSSLVPPQVPSQPPPNLRSPLAANSAAKMPPGLHSSLRVTVPPSIANTTTSATAAAATVISPRALQNSSATSNSSNARTPQRQRHLEQHKQRLEGSHQKLDASTARQHQAQERRQFLSDHQNLRQGASWAVMLCIAARTHRFLHCARVLAAQKRRMIRNGGKLVFPSVMVGVRRALRRARTRLLVHQHQYERPPLVSLRNDKILGLFPDDVLRCATRSMAIRYFFPNEAIVFMGCEDDEAYVLASGSADVMMGATKVFTMQPGMVFGTIGMVSGEPRSASIFARGESVMAWVMKRAVFDAAGDSAAIDAAHEALAEVRQKNIMNVYKSRLDPVALSAFPLFHGLAHETLQGLLLGAVSRVVRKNTVLADPTQPISAVSHLLLLKGKVTLSFKEPPPRLVHSDSVFDTVSELRNTLDVPPKLLSNRLSMLFGTRRCEKTNRLAHDLEHEVCAPALLNVNSLFLPGGMMRPTPFVITAATDCDLLSLSRRTLRGQDVLELAAIQQNALNAHADFLGAPTKREVATMLLDSIAPLFSVMPSAQAVLATLRASTATGAVFGSMKVEKWVYPRGGYMCFERSSEFLLNIVLEGEMEGIDSGSVTMPFVWPSVADAWFAARDAVGRTTKRTVCLRIHRCDLVSWVCRALLDAQDLRTVCVVFANHIVHKAGVFSYHNLTFSALGLDDPLWKTDVSLPYALVKVNGPPAMPSLNSPRARQEGATAGGASRPQSSSSQRKSSSGGSYGSGGAGLLMTAHEILSPIIEAVVQQLKANTGPPPPPTPSNSSSRVRKNSPPNHSIASPPASHSQQVSPLASHYRQHGSLAPTVARSPQANHDGGAQSAKGVKSSVSPHRSTSLFPNTQDNKKKSPAGPHQLLDSPSGLFSPPPRAPPPPFHHTTSDIVDQFFERVGTLHSDTTTSSSVQNSGFQSLRATKSQSNAIGPQPGGTPAQLYHRSRSGSSRGRVEDNSDDSSSTRVYYRPVQLPVSLETLRGKTKPSKSSKM